MNKLFEGKISDVKVHSKALSEDEIKQLYNEPVTLESLAAEIVQLKQKVSDLHSTFDERVEKTIKEALRKQELESYLRSV
jgi:hypothetical protein